MPKIKFTDLSIKNLIPAEKSLEYFESDRKSGDGSFGLRVSPRGKKTWFAMYKPETGPVKRYSLGTYPDMSLKDARAACADTIAAKRGGGDKQAEKVRKRHAPTVNDLWNAYIQKRSMRQVPKAQRTIYEEDRRWNKIISRAIGSMKVEDITPGMLSELLEAVAKDAPVSANRLHGLLRVMFKPALAKGWITIHPMQWIDKPGGPESPKKRVLSDEEIRTFWPQFEKLRSNPRDILKLGLLTAQRPGEIMSMRWEDVDMVKGVWTIRDTKVGNDHLVPLSRQVAEILEDRIEYQAREADRRAKRYKIPLETYQWVFQSDYNQSRGAEAGHAKSTKQARKKLIAETGSEKWSAHDLRRSARTIMSRLKIEPHIRELVLNHSVGKIQATYDVYDYLPEKRQALQKLANEIDHIRGAKVASNNVVKLHHTGI